MTAVVIAIPLILMFYYAFVFFGAILVTLLVLVRYVLQVFAACVIYLLSFPLIKWATIGAMVCIVGRLAN